MKAAPIKSKTSFPIPRALVPASTLSLAQLRSPAMLYRRLDNADGSRSIEELVASGPLIFLMSKIRSLATADRRRYTVSSVFGNLDADAIEEMGGRWWGTSASRSIASQIHRNLCPVL
jgi:hypothetical protein